MERALKRLNPQDTEVISRVGLYQYSREEVATRLRRGRSCVVQRFAESADHLAGTFLASGLLRDDRPDRGIHRFNPEATSA